MEIKVRELQVRDIFTIARALAKITKEARVELASVLSEKKTKPTEVGLALFQSVFTVAEDDLKDWLASLIEREYVEGASVMTPQDVRDEFDTMPAMTLLDIIEDLAAKEDIKDFFVRASSLVTKISKV